MPYTRSRQILYFVGLLLYFIVFFKNAWVGDDAYILFRSLDQLLDGHGPRWNPHERVQVFTCPLWYWLLAGLGGLYRNHYLNSILLSAACNLLLLWNLQKIFADARLWLFAVLMLVLSQAYFDFTTSGLENPLTYCLLTFALRFYLNREGVPAPKALLYTASSCGLLLVTRHDMLLLVAPLLLHTIWLARKQQIPATTALIALLSPLAIWTAFALFYYGFPLPNTAYAKLGSVVSREWLLQRGVTYFTTSILRDLISIAVLCAGLLIGALNRNSRIRMMTGGVMLHLTYVIWIGGDFMRGRFFSWDYLLCVILMLYPITALTSPILQKKRIQLLAGAALFCSALSWALWPPPLATPLNWGAEPFKMGDTADGVTQERYFFFWFTSFMKSLQRQTPLLEDFGWCQDGLEQKRQGLLVAASHTVGMHGFCLGTDHILVDSLGITDPMLARMPRNPSQKNWRPGHFVRLLPSGYCESVARGKNELTDPVTSQYYENLLLITQSADYFSIERIKAIWRINTGYYSGHLASIHADLIQSLKGPAGREAQAQTQSYCPFVQLPPALIEQLKHPSP